MNNIEEKAMVAVIEILAITYDQLVQIRSRLDALEKRNHEEDLRVNEAIEWRSGRTLPMG